MLTTAGLYSIAITSPFLMSSFDLLTSACQGLEAIRKQKGTASDPLEPSWGEPELLMSLAWCELNRTTPDVNAAEQDAQAALRIVPYWHYVKDMLMPQIQEAKRKQNPRDPI